MYDLGFRLRVFLAILVVIVAAGTAGFMVTEKLSLYDAFYFSIVTITTVGYGDISPVSNAGKVLSILLIVTGVGTFLGVVANATEILLQRQEKKIRREKMNMVISAFFTEIGTRLLTLFVESDPSIDSIGGKFAVSGEWSDEEFGFARSQVKGHEFTVDINRIDLDTLRTLLDKKGDLLLRFLENPSILEHESFTGLLRAISHLREELLYRGDFRELPASDLTHLAGDIRRSYSQLTAHWLDYIKYLKEYYPYLFSLAVRMNPFHKARSPVVRE